MMAVSSSYRANSTWCEVVGMSINIGQTTEEIRQIRSTPARMSGRDDVFWKDASNVSSRRQDDMICTWWDGS
jgi:argininosuccinate synthase